MEWGVKAANPCIRATLGMHLFWSTVLVPASRGLPNIPGIIILKFLVHCLLLIQLNLGYRLKQHQPRHCETPCWVAFFSERCCKIWRSGPTPFRRGRRHEKRRIRAPDGANFFGGPDCLLVNLTSSWRGK